MSAGGGLAAGERGYIRRALPGVALTAAIAGAALWLHQLPGVAVFSPLFIAIAIGAAIRNVWALPSAAQEGVTFSVRRILRTAVVLLGLQLSVVQIVDVGLQGLLIVLTVLFTTLIF